MEAPASLSALTTLDRALGGADRIAPCLLFSSDPSALVVDTSELQRDAFNRAFEQHGLAWRWEREEYAALLAGNGGADRIADYAAERGEDVDVAAVHATKSRAVPGGSALRAS